MASTINETQVRQWMFQKVGGYVSFADERYVVDTFNLARDAFYFFTGEIGSPPAEYQTIAMHVGNDEVRRRNSGG